MANTGRLPETSDRLIRRLQTLGVGLLLVTVLAACSTGNAETANEASTREAAESTNVVAEIEETQVVSEFFGPTKEPTAYPTRMPSLNDLKLTTELRDQNAPGNQLYIVSEDTTVYADAQVANLFPGQRVVALWKDSGNVIATSEVQIDNERELVWIPLRWDVPAGTPPGTYAVVVQVVGPGFEEGTPVELTTEIGSLVFEIQ